MQSVTVDGGGRYTLVKILQQTTQDRLLLAHDANNDRLVAIKQLRLHQRHDSHVLSKYLSGAHSTLANHRSLVHPNITQLLDVFLTPDQGHLCLVLEYAEAGTLREHARSYQTLFPDGRVLENMARYYFRQLVLALDFMHAKGIYHRDLKLEHLLLHVSRDTNGRSFFQLKVCDLGLSKHESRDITNTRVGSHEYAAPEVLEGQNHRGPELDVWSAGVCLFMLITGGQQPFRDPQPQNGRTLVQEMCLMRRQRLYQHDIDPRLISQECRDLLDQLLEPNAGVRITLDGIKKDPWVRQGWDVDWLKNRRYLDPQEFPPPCEKCPQDLQQLQQQARAQLA